MGLGPLVLWLKSLVACDMNVSIIWMSVNAKGQGHAQTLDPGHFDFSSINI